MSLAPRLHDDAQLALAEERLDRAHDPRLAADADSRVDLERLVGAAAQSASKASRDSWVARFVGNRSRAH
jgi:hypothetical protein